MVRTAARRGWSAPGAAAAAETEEERRAKRLAKRLCQAARNGDAKQMATLLDGGTASIDLAGFGGSTALMVSAWNDRADCVALLLERGAHIDKREPDYGYSALILAAQYGALSAAQLLVMGGADLSFRLRGGPDEGMTARALAQGGSSRVYADPQPGRAVRASHSRDSHVGRGRIDSQHAAVAALLSRAERARVGARQRLAFASCLLERHGGPPRGQCRTFAHLPRNADGGCDLIWSGLRAADEAAAPRDDAAAPDTTPTVYGQHDDSDCTPEPVRCAWPHLHPPTCTCTASGKKSGGVVMDGASGEMAKLAERIAELDAAQQRCRTGKFDFQQLRRLEEEAVPLKRRLLDALIAQHRSGDTGEQLQVLENLGAGAMSIIDWLARLQVPQKVIDATLNVGDQLL
jgi:hypothetical protein